MRISDWSSDVCSSDLMYRPSVKLAIYGTLAPGKVNHHHIAGLGGAWQDTAVRGSLGRVPCGIHEGLPAMLLDPASPLHPLKLLTCEGLPAAWPRLDAFEGEEMQRLLVPHEPPRVCRRLFSVGY